VQTLHGNTSGLKAEQDRGLRALYERRIPADRFVHPALARRLTELSRETGRRIGLLVDRNGEIDKVVVGEAHRVFLPNLGARRAGAGRLRGLRLIHTSLRPEGLTEDDLTDLALLQLDAVVTIHVQPDGLPGKVQWAHLLPPDADAPWRLYDVPSVHEWEEDWSAFVTDLEAQLGKQPAFRTVHGAEGTILVGITGRKPLEARRSLDELRRLALTAGLEVLDEELQRRDEPDPKGYIGTGKLQELVVRSMHLGASVLVFDAELSPSQLRNIAERTELKVLDRTQLILDIFAQHAKSSEGKLQVELAQLRYAMPRLAIMPTAMSRLTGGIGGRGPGETKLEINRRRAQDRVVRVERQLEELGEKRALRRRSRQRGRVPQVSIVGYTNAGKSTLLNRLTNSEVLAADQLFATLDPTSRRYRFPEEREIVVTDTVGFIEDLPATLVRAFKATLEELDEADLLLHVLDASDPYVEHHRASVEQILADLELADRPTLLVWNKADVATPQTLDELRHDHGGVAVSAMTGEGCARLLDEVERRLFLARLGGAPGPGNPETTPAIPEG
jgi:GTP-binding protein HflX